MKDQGNGQFRDVDPAPAVCPKCGKTVDAATNLKGAGSRAPAVGDFSICVYCTGVLVYVDDRFLREAEPEEIPAELAEIAGELRKFKEERRQRPAFILGGRIS